LIYYTDKGKEAKGAIDLSGSKTAPISNTKQFTFCISFGSEQKRNFTFSVSSAEELKDWVEKINAATATIGNKINLEKSKVIPKVSVGNGETGEDPEIAEILNYWFSQVASDDANLTQDLISFWFLRSSLVDDLIRNNFGAVWEKAVKGECDHWAKTPRGVIALVILLDQFSRNMFRETPKMFGGDNKCYEIVEKFLAEGGDKKLPLHQRTWVYLVLQRKEDIKAADKAVLLIEEVVAEATKRGKNQDFYAQGAKFSKQQQDLIKRFGRFPVRNGIIGRENTPEEVAYLTSDTKYFST